MLKRCFLLVVCVGDFDLWISSSQMTDLVYIFSGGKASEMPKVLETLRGVRQFINVYAPGEVEIDKILLTSWQDPEEALMHEVALSLRVDAIISRNTQD